MTEDRLRDLLHESVDGTVGPDLAEVAWRRAVGRRRRQYVATVGVAALFVAVGAGAVQLLTPDRPTPPVSRPSHSAPRPSETPSSTPPAERPDASYLGVPVWWAPEDATADPVVEGAVLPAELDLSVPAPDAAEEPIGGAVAAFCDTGTFLTPADGPVRLVGPDGEQRDVDVSGMRGLAFDGAGRMSAVDRSMLAPDGRTLVFPQDDHAMLFDIPSGEWSRLDVRATSGIRWADASTLYLPGPAGAGGRLVGLDGTREGRANLTDVVRPGVDLGEVSLVGPWRAGSGGAVAQTYDGRRGTVPGRSGSDADQTYVVVRGRSGTEILVLGPTDEPGWSLLADWLDPQTLVVEVVGEGDGRARLVSWRIGTHDFALASTIGGLEADGHRFIGSYALGG
jgi:hypothetical protein